MQHDLQELHYIVQVKNNENLPVVDRESIADLLTYSYTLYSHYKTQKKANKFSSYINHAFAIGDSLYVIYDFNNNHNKSTLILYLPFIILFATMGFKYGNRAKENQSQYIEYQQQYNSLKQVINTASPQIINQIAKIWQENKPDEKEQERNGLNPEIIKETVHHILMKYQR